MIRFKFFAAVAAAAVFAFATAGCETAENYADSSGGVPGASSGGGSSGGKSGSPSLKLSGADVDINVSGSESSFVPISVSNAAELPGYSFKWKASPTNYGSLTSSSGTSTAFEPTSSGAYAGRTATVTVTCTATGLETLTAARRITIHFN